MSNAALIRAFNRITVGANGLARGSLPARRRRANRGKQIVIQTNPFLPNYVAPPLRRRQRNRRRRGTSNPFASGAERIVGLPLNAAERRRLNGTECVFLSIDVKANATDLEVIDPVSGATKLLGKWARKKWPMSKLEMVEIRSRMNSGQFECTAGSDNLFAEWVYDHNTLITGQLHDSVWMFNNIPIEEWGDLIDQARIKCTAECHVEMYVWIRKNKALSSVGGRSRGYTRDPYTHMDRDNKVPMHLSTVGR